MTEKSPRHLYIRHFVIIGDALINTTEFYMCFFGTYICSTVCRYEEIDLAFLNQAHAWFLRIALSLMSVCVFVCVCVYPRPEAINN